MIKLRWSAWIWRQNEQKCWVSRKPFKTTQITKVIKVQWFASIWCQNDKKCWVTFQTIQIQQNYKSDQITMNCIDLTLKRSKMLSYVPNHSKQRKSTKVIKLRWIASIWCQNDKKCWVTSQTIPNTRKSTKVIKLRWSAWIWCQNDKKCWVTFQTIRYKQNYKSYQITMNCIDLTSKRSKMLSYVPNHSKHSKTTKVIKLRWIASIWRKNDKKCWVTSQTIPNTAKLQK